MYIGRGMRGVVLNSRTTHTMFESIRPTGVERTSKAILMASSRNLRRSFDRTINDALNLAILVLIHFTSVSVR